MFEIALLKRSSVQALALVISPRVWIVVSYRLERAAYLLFGQSWQVLRLAFLPLIVIVRLLGGGSEISFMAKIGKGLQIRHPSLGVVVHGRAILGERCQFAGGNSVGGRTPLEKGQLTLGDNVFLGVNAVILGPVSVGSDSVIGAGAVVTASLPPGSVAVGVPARVVRTRMDTEE